MSRRQSAPTVSCQRSAVEAAARRQFSLQARIAFGTFEYVRFVLPLATLLAGISAALAQQQESKLIDRLLRPNLTLANPAQNKKFPNNPIADVHKPARTRTFPALPKPAQKTYSEQRTLPPRQFGAGPFHKGDSVADLSSRSHVAKTDTIVNPPSVSVQVAPESGTTIPVREYTGSRSFLAEGKSQQALRTQNKPLTIEQVRELLNKSK
jgi:hypothetical protein